MYKVSTYKDKERTLDILEQAFIDSPGTTWMLNKNTRSLRKFLNYLFYVAKNNNGAYLTEDKNGVVFYYNIRNQKTTFLNILRKLYVFFFVLGLRNGIKTIKYQKIISNIRPKKGYVGLLVAVDKSLKNNNAAYEIKNEMFRLSDDLKEPIYVETTKERVMLLYKASGYYEYAKIPHPFINLTIWFMRRDPKT